MDRVIITGDWPSERARRRILDALDRAGELRHHVPVLIDMRELRPETVPNYRDLLDSFWRALEADTGARRAILTPADALEAARALLSGIRTTAPIEFFTDEAAAIRWLRTSEVWDRR